MDNKKKLNPILLITIVGIVIVLVVVSIFIFNRGDDTADTPENGDNSQQPTSQPDTKLTLEDLTSADFGLECTQNELTTTADELRNNFTALEPHQINLIDEVYGPGDEGLNKYIETYLQIQSFSCETDAGTQLEVVLSDQIEGSEFHNLINTAYAISNHPASSECAVGSYWDAKFANAVITYSDSIQRSAEAARREAHITLLTEISESLGSELQDKCPENNIISEEEVAKTKRLTDISSLQANLITYAFNNNGQLPAEIGELRQNISFSYYNDGNALTNADATAIGTTPLTASTASQFLFGDYNQVALAETELPDVDHFHIIFKASCGNTEKLSDYFVSDYSVIEEGNPRRFAIIFRAEEDKVRCVGS